MSYYPTILAGQRITSGLLNSMMPNMIVKQSSEDRSATTTLTADSDLTVTLEANAQYYIEMNIGYATTTVAGFKTDWTVPSGASGGRSSIGNGPTQHTYLDVTGNFGIHSFNTVVLHGDRNHSTNQLWLLERGVVNTVSSGTLAFRWAQNTSDATLTRVGSNSWMSVRRLA